MAAPPPPRDEQAYLLLEEARIRCLRLRNTECAGERLRVVYRELGMAGYMASSRIPSERRRLLLAEAGDRCTRTPSGAHGICGLMQLAASAAAAVDRALVAPGITDHVQTAAEHLMRARLALGDALAAASTAAPTHALHS